MYFPSLKEFSNLNYEQKIQIVENIQNIIESQKKKYLKQNNDEILISSYIPNNSNLNNIQITENDLSSSTSSDDININITKKNDVIQQAKNNIIKAKKDFEKFQMQYYLYKLSKEKNKEINEEIIKETNHDKEINYMIESTTNSYNSSYNNNNFYNYQNNDNSINNDYINDIRFSKIKKIPLNINHNKNVYTFKKKLIKENIKENMNKSEKCKLIKSRTNINNSIKKNRINSSIEIRNKMLPTKINNYTLQSQGKKNITKSCSNIDKKQEFKKIDKIQNINIIKKKLNFSEINKNNKSNKNLLRTLSCTHRKKIDENDISNRLYNMDKIIKEKINLKKKKLEEEEMKNCSFIPKINNKSRKIAKKLEMRNEAQKEKFKKITGFNFFNHK
jgi:hypothetical protein